MRARVKTADEVHASGTSCCPGFEEGVRTMEGVVVELGELFFSDWRCRLCGAEGRRMAVYRLVAAMPNGDRSVEADCVDIEEGS